MESDSARGAIQLELKILARNGISARAEKQETIWLPPGSRSDFSGIKAVNYEFQCESECWRQSLKEILIIRVI